MCRRRQTANTVPSPPDGGVLKEDELVNQLHTLHAAGAQPRLQFLPENMLITRGAARHAPTKLARHHTVLRVHAQRWAVSPAAQGLGDTCAMADCSVGFACAARPVPQLQTAGEARRPVKRQRAGYRLHAHRQAAPAWSRSCPTQRGQAGGHAGWQAGGMADRKATKHASINKKGRA
eukprot:366119-Chlamydomonas_euryale.AAC.45